MQKSRKDIAPPDDGLRNDIEFLELYTPLQIYIDFLYFPQFLFKSHYKGDKYNMDQI